jgi:hypothetical protein
MEIEEKNGKCIIIHFNGLGFLKKPIYIKQ